MENVYRNFYRNFYLKTNGFMPTSPLNHPIYPGDFFQISRGEMIVLGNIFRSGLIVPESADISSGIRLNPASWNFSDRVTKPYAGRGSGKGAIAGEFEFSKQILAFAAKGAFIFRGSEPESVKIKNWNDLQQALIIKLTQTCYSFREVYVVTEIATTADWTLAISGSEQAELEIATDTENFGLVDIFGLPSAKTIQLKDMEFYYRESHRKPVFYKAKKLVVQDNKREVFISELIHQRQDQNEWAREFYAYNFHYDAVYRSEPGVNTQANLLDMLQANQLNPNTALQYFKWVDASLDDIEKLFQYDGN